LKAGEILSIFNSFHGKPYIINYKKEQIDMPYERTFAMLKPGVLQRRIVGDIITRMENKGLKLIGMKMMSLSREICEKHYSEHKGKEFYEPLLKYMTAGPVLAMVLTGENAIRLLRILTGPTNVEEAQPGTIRGDYCMLTRKNILHASDSLESAEREISLFFKDEEILEYEAGNEEWYY
jgi:nucleoside-diphosphate kinase